MWDVLILLNKVSKNQVSISFGEDVRALNLFQERCYLLIELINKLQITTLFVEQPLASPGSANKTEHNLDVDFGTTEVGVF